MTLKADEKLTDEQKETIIREIQHMLMMDCYDFTISVGGYDIAGGMMASLPDDEEEEE